jgi:ribosomal protein L11 methyltransferase
LFSLLLHSPPDREDYLIAELSDENTTGIVEEDGGIRAFFEDDRDPAQLLDRFTEFSPELRREASVDWAQATREAWPPLLIGQRFFLVASWSNETGSNEPGSNETGSDEPTPDGRLRLEIYPGRVCGTGRHPATQLCLEAMEEYVRPGDRVLDVGAGSGILSAAAALLGAGHVVGCDVDHDAVEIARERIRLPLFTGSANAVRSQWADVVIANIDSATIERLAPELARVRKPRSTLILSGFPEGDQPEGFLAKKILRREEWRCLIC